MESSQAIFVCVCPLRPLAERACLLFLPQVLAVDLHWFYFIYGRPHMVGAPSPGRVLSPPDDNHHFDLVL